MYFSPEITLGTIAIIITLLGGFLAFWWKIAQMEIKINILFTWFMRKFKVSSKHITDEEVVRFYGKDPKRKRR